MRRLLVLSAVSLACGNVLAAADVNVSCSMDSDYDLAINERSVIFTRDSGVPKAVVMRQGRLFIDDRWVVLEAPDSRRIAEFEKGVRAAMPEAQAIGRDAADIAFTVLGEVAAGFASDPKAVQAKIAKARSQIDARLARSVSPTRFDGHDLGEGIAAAVSEVIPSMIGDIVGGAISAAFSGDSSRLKRLENLDAQIDERVEPRARSLERRAQALCARMVELDRIDDSLEYRLPDGRALDLLRARAPEEDAPKEANPAAGGEAR